MLAQLKEVGSLTEASESTILKDKANAKARRRKKRPKVSDAEPKGSVQAVSKRPETTMEI